MESDGNRYVAHWVHDAELAAQGVSLYPRDLVKQLEALG